MTGLPPEVERALANARLLCLDVDGTLTDGAVAYAGESGDELLEVQRYSVHDGAGIAWVRAAGVRVVWITGRGCAATRRRAAELGVDALLELAGRKDELLAQLQAQMGVTSEATIAMGDDLQDLDLSRRAALLCCPADARPEVRARAGLVTAARGGHGAVREVCEAILRARGEWEALLERFGG